jgi:hypothetical protein
MNTQTLELIAKFAPVASAVVSLCAFITSLFVASIFFSGNRVARKNLLLAQQNIQQSRELQQENLRLTRDSKKVDILIQTTQRYVDIWEKLKAVEERETAEDATKLYMRFWSLQREQYRYWCMGFIDDSDYKLWLQYRHKECGTAKPIGGLTYRTGAEMALDFIAHKEFSQLIRHVLDGEIDQAMATKPK